jgi:hypothetical protein
LCVIVYGINIFRVRGRGGGRGKPGAVPNSTQTCHNQDRDGAGHAVHTRQQHPTSSCSRLFPHSPCADAPRFTRVSTRPPAACGQPPRPLPPYLWDEYVSIAIGSSDLQLTQPHQTPHCCTQLLQTTQLGLLRTLALTLGHSTTTTHSIAAGPCCCCCCCCCFIAA